MKGGWWGGLVHTVRQVVLAILGIAVLVIGISMLPRDTLGRVDRSLKSFWEDLKASRGRITDFFTHDDIRKSVGEYDGLKK